MDNEMTEFEKIFGRLIGVLKAKGVMDDLDTQYILGLITKEEFEEKHKELYSKDKLFKTIFAPFDQTGERSKT